MSNEQSTISISPTSFTEDMPDLSVLSLEEVISRFGDTEKRRNRTSEPESEAEVTWPLRQAPIELLSSLRLISYQLGVSRRVLTKCMSRHMVDWYVHGLGLDLLKLEYDTIYSKIKKKGYSTLRVQAEHPARFSYACPLEATKTSLSSIRWVVAKLQEVRDIVGVSCTDLLLSGMAWSLTTLEHRDWDQRSIERLFLPEVCNISTLVNDRMADVRALCSKFNYRESIGYNSQVYREEK